MSLYRALQFLSSVPRISEEIPGELLLNNACNVLLNDGCKILLSSE